MSKTAGQLFYEDKTGNDPIVHSNRFLSWSELTNEQQAVMERDAARDPQWAEKAAALAAKEPKVAPADIKAFFDEVNDIVRRIDALDFSIPGQETAEAYALNINTASKRLLWRVDKQRPAWDRKFG